MLWRRSGYRSDFNGRSHQLEYFVVRSFAQQIILFTAIVVGVGIIDLHGKESGLEVFIFSYDLKSLLLGEALSLVSPPLSDVAACQLSLLASVLPACRQLFCDCFSPHVFVCVRTSTGGNGGRRHGEHVKRPVLHETRCHSVWRHPSPCECHRHPCYAFTVAMRYACPPVLDFSFALSENCGGVKALALPYVKVTVIGGGQ